MNNLIYIYAIKKGDNINNTITFYIKEIKTY